VRTIAGVEDGIVFENDDGSFDGVEGVPAVCQDGPSGVKRAKTAGLRSVDGVVGDVPGTAMDDERGSHEGRKRITEERVKNRRRGGVSEGGGRRSNEEIEGEKEQTKEQQEGTPGEAAARELHDGLDESRGDNDETRLAAALIKRTGRDVPAEIASEGGEFVVHPEGDFGAVAPQRVSADNESAITQESQKPKSRTRTPIKHGTSPRAGQKTLAVRRRPRQTNQSSS